MGHRLVDHRRGLLCGVGAVMAPKYPDIHVQLSGEDGNIFFIGGRVGRAMRKTDIDPSEIDAFYEELHNAPSYDHALRVVKAWVDTS